MGMSPSTVVVMQTSVSVAYSPVTMFIVAMMRIGSATHNPMMMPSKAVCTNLCNLSRRKYGSEFQAVYKSSLEALKKIREFWLVSTAFLGLLTKFIERLVFANLLNFQPVPQVKGPVSFRGCLKSTPQTRGHLSHLQIAD